LWLQDQPFNFVTIFAGPGKRWEFLVDGSSGKGFQGFRDPGGTNGFLKKLRVGKIPGRPACTFMP